MAGPMRSSVDFFFIKKGQFTVQSQFNLELFAAGNSEEKYNAFLLQITGTVWLKSYGLIIQM